MENVTDAVLSVIRQTREMLLPHWGHIKEQKRKTGAAVDAVTRLDLEVETYLQDALNKTFPTIKFAGEEFGGSREEERFWLCDPIDATGHFIHGLPFCTVMLALIEKQQVNFSVIYDFINDIAYHATRGRGAFANDVPIHVSDRPLSHAYLIVESRREQKDDRDKYRRLYKKAGVLEMLTAGWTFAMVASGKLDGRLTFDGWGFDYDFAPGSLLVHEAGGIVANIGKRTYDYRDGNFLAVNPLVFKELTEGPDAIFPVAQ